MLCPHAEAIVQTTDVGQQAAVSLAAEQTAPLAAAQPLRTPLAEAIALRATAQLPAAARPAAETTAQHAAVQHNR